MVKVNGRKIEFREGMTVAETVKLAGENLDQMVIVVVNGNVISKGDLNRVMITRNAEILLLPLVSGG